MGACEDEEFETQTLSEHALLLCRTETRVDVPFCLFLMLLPGRTCSSNMLFCSGVSCFSHSTCRFEWDCSRQLVMKEVGEQGRYSFIIQCPRVFGQT